MCAKYVTKEKAKVDRIACPWLITRFVDKKAEFLFVPKEQVFEVAKKENAIPFDVKGAEFNHYEENGQERVTFDAIIRKHRLTDAALLDMAEIVRGADADLKEPRKESVGLEAFALGFRLNARDDHDNMAKQFHAYDALYSYCKWRVQEKGKLEHSVK